MAVEAFNSCRGGKISVTSRTVCSTYWALGQWTEEEGKRSGEEERRERGRKKENGHRKWRKCGKS